mmetsp:Transcript_95/g.169  ORF Transcript_95/g.169 Transcript_95/m.169 type:complete len:81 (-) Transcript_95:206-448(-)
MFARSSAQRDMNCNHQKVCAAQKTDVGQPPGAHSLHAIQHRRFCTRSRLSMGMLVNTPVVGTRAMSSAQLVMTRQDRRNA